MWHKPRWRKSSSCTPYRYVYTCIRACLHTVSTCLHMSTCTHLCAHVNTQICAHVHASTHVRTHMSMPAHISAHISAQLHIRQAPTKVPGRVLFSPTVVMPARTLARPHARTHARTPSRPPARTPARPHAHTLAQERSVRAAGSLVTSLRALRSVEHLYAPVGDGVDFAHHQGTKCVWTCVSAFV